MNDDELRRLLSGMRDEPVPPESLRRMRARVAERTERRAWWRWWMPAALAAALCTLLFAVWLRQPAAMQAPVIPSSPPQIAKAPEIAPPVVVPAAAPVVKPVARGQRRPARSIESQKNSNDIVIRIETPDPDVIILLVGD